MRYYQLCESGTRRLAVGHKNHIYDLTAAAPRLTSFRDIAKAARSARTSLDDITAHYLQSTNAISEEMLWENVINPATADEVWAAGVTYQISEQAREAESSMPDIYLDVYDADRPELFFKATPSRTVGPNDAVGIRGDSTWDVPEPELGIVLYDGDTVGYTIGNDVSSRSIEGANPLYLPQAKVYDRCCSIGPCITTDIDNPHSLGMSMSITRDGESLFEERTNTSEMVRECEDLVSYFNAHNRVPELAILLTGTSLVPDDDFTLQQGDRIDIEVDQIGVLTNSVIPV